MPRGVEGKEPVVTTESTITKTSEKEVHWTVPPKTTKVTLTEYNTKGEKVSSHTITNFIAMKPGHRFIIKAE